MEDLLNRGFTGPSTSSAPNNSRPAKAIPNEAIPESELHKNNVEVQHFSPKLSHLPRIFTAPNPRSPTSPKSGGSSWRLFHFLKNKGDESESPPKKLKRTSTLDSAPFDETAVWDGKAILSLDGGGIRGYSALLILRELMRAIGRKERAWPGSPAESSFHPLEPVLRRDTDAGPTQSQTGVETPNTESSPWLPCHYFDYMAGTSTGGLISIMLGRLRMNIDDCISDYETLGHQVFGHPRWFHLRTPLFWPRDKFNHKHLERAVREVIDKRSRYVAGGKIFASDENRCRTIVLSFQKPETTGVETPYVFRTYDNFQRNEDAKKRMLDRNPGPADDSRIWEVARATSAAPTYFQPMKIDGVEYIDGGFGANNPCIEIYDEVRRMNNGSDECVSIIVSVGTGKNTTSRFRGTGLRRYIGYLNFATKWASESEKAHEDMLKIESGGPYVRFNVENGLGGMKLDEWRYRGSMRLYIGEIIGKIKSLTSERQREQPSGEVQDEKSPFSAVLPLPSAQNIPEWFQAKNITLESITKYTRDYLDDPVTKKSIEECATLLVKARRARAEKDIVRWEKTCYRTWYHCKIHKCPRGEFKYQSRGALKRHILAKHPDHPPLELEAMLDQGKVLIS